MCNGYGFQSHASILLSSADMSDDRDLRKPITESEMQRLNDECVFDVPFNRHLAHF